MTIGWQPNSNSHFLFYLTTTTTLVYLNLDLTFFGITITFVHDLVKFVSDVQFVFFKQRFNIVTLHACGKNSVWSASIRIFNKKHKS